MAKPTRWDSLAETETPPAGATAAVVVVAQNAELAHGLAWVVASTAGPDRWDAISWSQLIGAARWTCPHNSGRPSGNIWPLSSSVATNLTSENLMRDSKIAPSHRPASSPFDVPGRASARAVGAEGAAVAGLRPKKRSTCCTLVDVDAGVGWHRFSCLVAAVGASRTVGSVKHLAHLPCEDLTSEGLLEVRDAGLEHAVAHHGIVSVAGRVQHPDLGSQRS